jgi:glycosyltransferase involved in cell wall biosynthesis
MMSSFNSEKTGLRVAFLGNQDNFAYRFCKWLRTFDLDCHLFLHPDNLGKGRADPSLVDAGATPGSLSWLHVMEDLTGWYPYLRKTAFSERIAREFDAVITSGAAIMFGFPYDGMPVFHFALGGDVRDVPRIGWCGSRSMDEKVAAWIYRMALGRCSRIFSGISGGTARTMNLLQVTGRTMYLGFPEDMKRNIDIRDADLLADLNRKYARYDKVFLWFSRLNYLDDNNRLYKGADLFLKAFAEVARESNVRAVVARHGQDADAWLTMAGKLGVMDRIDLVDHLPFSVLICYLSLDNGVVFDSFNPGSRAIGGVSREALSVGACLVRNTSRETIDALYGSQVPFDIVDSAEQCQEVMRRFVDMDAVAFAKRREAILQWAREHLHYEKALSMRQIMHELKTQTLADQCMHREFGTSGLPYSLRLRGLRAMLVFQRALRSILRGKDVG